MLEREERYLASSAGLKRVEEGAGAGGQERREERREWYRARMAEAAGSCHRLSALLRPWWPMATRQSLKDFAMEAG